MPAPNPTENELHAFVDNELDPVRHDEVAAFLRQDDTLAARVAAWQSDRDLLRQAFDEMIDQPQPTAWTARIEAAMAPRRRIVPKIVMTRRFALAASVALLASVAAAVRLSRTKDETILAEAEAARDGRLDGQLASGDPLPPPSARDALMQSTLNMPVRAPELGRLGFTLAGMTLYNRPSGGAAYLRYSDVKQRSVDIFVRHSDGIVQFDILRRGDTHVCIWQDDVVGAVITAQVSAAEMLRIATSAYTSLNL